MTFVPIVQRELRGRARSWPTYWLRSAAGLIGVLFCVPYVLMLDVVGNPAYAGMRIFDGVVGAAFLLGCFACLLTVDAISGERREGTLGLLLLTRVSSLDIVLGKLGSVGISTLCALAALFPVLMIPVLLGGVTAGEASRKGLALLSVLPLSLAAGLFASARTHDRSRAQVSAMLLLCLLVLVPAGLAWLAGPSRLGSLAGAISPLFLLVSAGDGEYQSDPAAYWLSLAAVNSSAGLILAGTSSRLRRDSALEPKPGRTGPARSRGRFAAAASDPVEWLVLRQPGLQAAFWCAALLMVVFSGLGMLLVKRALGPSRIHLVQVPALAATTLSTTLLAWGASRFFLEARRTGGLELLLSTPQGAKSILVGQWQALRRSLNGPVLVMALFLLLRWASIADPSTGFAFSGMWFFPLVSVLLSLLALVFSVLACCWVGLWLGLKARGPAGAIILTVSLVQGVPYLAQVLWFGLCAAAVQAGLVAGFGYSAAIWLSSTAVTLVVCWGLIRWARRQLLRELPGAAECSLFGGLGP